MALLYPLLLLLVIGLIALLPPTADGVEAHEVVVSLAVDASNVEIQYEAIRLLTSLQHNGGTLSTSRVAVCISYEGENETTIDPQLLASLQQYNLWSVRYSKRYSLPALSPSLNKLCALDPPGVGDDDYLLYLDADIFVVSDPLVALTRYAAQADVLCGRPWNTFRGVGPDDFFEFVGLPSMFEDARYPLLESFAGGRTLYGMCNSGMYFMPALVARAMVAAARVYLTRATTPQFRDKEFYSPSSFGIDSAVLWAAQYSLNYTVAIAPTTLNFMASTEPFMPRFLQRDRDRVVASLAEAGALVGGPAEALLLAEVEVPILAHFSQGSELYVFYREREQEATGPQTTPTIVTADAATTEAAPEIATTPEAALDYASTGARVAEPSDIPTDWPYMTAEVTSSGDVDALPPATPVDSHTHIHIPTPTLTFTCVVNMQGHLRAELGESRLLPVAYGLINNNTECEAYADALAPYSRAMKAAPQD
jgi:hypothetical protein